MIPYTIGSEQRHVRTSWAEVSLSEYVQCRTGNTFEALCLLAELKLEEFRQDDPVHVMLLELASDLLATEPEGSGRPVKLPYSLGAASIGKLELCKLYLRQFEEAREAAYPYLYAVYAWPGEYDTVLSLSGAGFPANLLERAGAMKVTETIGAVAHIAQELERIGSRYAPILDKEPTIEQMNAGVEKFEKYGFYATLVNYASGNLTSMRDLVELPADAFYTAMCVDTERGEYLEQLQKVRNTQTA